MCISEAVESKIRFLCKNISEVEWSGVLFYTVEGEFEDESLVINCVDIFQMDEGVSTYTEFSMSPDVVSYMVDHPTLLRENVYQGLIHSHNNMSTFFSGTDTNTLKVEGNDMAHFVSLIVNNAGNYTAAITRKYKYTQSIVEDYSYSTWNNLTSTGKKEIIKECEELEWYNLEVIFEKTTNSFEDEMCSRMKEIKDSKKPAKGTVYPTHKYFQQQDTPLFPKSLNLEREDESSIYRGTYSDKCNECLAEKELDIYIPYGEVRINPEIVQSVVKQLITASAIITKESAVDIMKWATHIDSLYKKRFGTVKEFEYFASNYIDYLINYTEDENVLQELSGNGDIMEALLAYDVREELIKLPKSPWLDTYIELLDDYIC